MQSNLRPRQRTSTSCTECRRRKQKCNQARDRPCKNCARRYPPVDCTYDSGSSSRGSTVERLVDFECDEGRTDGETLTTHTNVNPSYEVGHRAATNYPATSEQHSSQSYYGSTQTSTNYWPQQDQSWNNQYAATTSSTYDESYYGSAGVPVGVTSDANCYSNICPYYTSQAGFYSTTGDPQTFVGTGTTCDITVDPSSRNADLYSFYEAETENS